MSKMVYSILLIIGFILVLVAGILFKRSLNFLENGERTTGIVTELISVYDDDGVTYKPVFKFKTSKNEDITYTHPISSSPPQWRVGETTGLIYDPDKPEDAKILTYFGMFGWAVIILSIAAPLLVIAGGYFLTQPLLR